MIATQQGSVRFFRIFGIQVWLHWSWFLIAVYQIQSRQGEYTSLTWTIAEYLALFVIVLMHEFGHALACRQVKGIADTIVLWPLGGIAYVRPPPRPGAELWSIAAGPLVNVALILVFAGLQWLAYAQGWYDHSADFEWFMHQVARINLGLLIFNLLPVYPLDGGQIFRSLLWFVFGRGRSLVIATVIGFIGIAAVVVAWLVLVRSNVVWTLFLGYFIFQQCLRGFQYGRALLKLEKAPRHAEYVCPTCSLSPPVGSGYACGNCKNAFDPFVTGGICPHCSTTPNGIPCLHCGTTHPIAEWSRPSKIAQI